MLYVKVYKKLPTFNKVTKKKGVLRKDIIIFARPNKAHNNLKAKLMFK